MIIEAYSLINIEKFKETGEDRVNDNNEVGSREMKENLSKVNSSTMHFLMPKARVTFICLKKAFTKVSVVHYFHPERHIRIETEISDSAISEISNQLSLRYMTYTN